MKNMQPTILIIFGASGDLTKRYLLPAIEQISKAGMLPEKFEIVGITRQKNSKLFQMDLEDINEYERLDGHLTSIEKKFGSPAQRLFHLSVPPKACKSIIEFIGRSSLAKNKNNQKNKILLEKPFGSDLESAKELVDHINKYFSDEQIYRIDHYMAKEATQNLIVFRDRNSLFKRTWNKDFIESIEIILSEKLDIEGRAHFYEQTGALRDMVQSHLLQLAALTLMELPEKEKLEEVPELREKALKNLNIVCDIENKNCVKRAQYEGYRTEVGNQSLTETFVSINLQSNDPAWRGVPITLTTGKALKERLTIIKVRYKKDKQEQESESNELLIRIQPDPGIEFGIWAKTPGYEHRVSEQFLHFIFKEYYEKLPEAYEQVLFNAINSDHGLFTTSGEVIETWRILEDVQEAWKKSSENLTIYKKGSTMEDVLGLK